MAENTGIEWTDHTANFWWGCSKVTAGCKNCYADNWARRFGKDIWGAIKKAGWKDIKKYNVNSPNEFGRRTKVFCQSMSDTFEEHPMLTEWRNEALHLMGECSNLDIQLLTKRPENVRSMVPVEWLENWPSHVWIGTSVENQEQADKRIPALLKIPARVRFLSCEPLLGNVDLGLMGTAPKDISPNYRPVGDLLHWVIAGGESGRNARPMQAQWARSLRDQCNGAGVAFFMKQMGGKRKPFPPIPSDLMVRQFPEGVL